MTVAPLCRFAGGWVPTTTQLFKIRYNNGSWYSVTLPLGTWYGCASGVLTEDLAAKLQALIRAVHTDFDDVTVVHSASTGKLTFGVAASGGAATFEIAWTGVSGCTAGELGAHCAMKYTAGVINAGFTWTKASPITGERPITFGLCPALIMVADVEGFEAVQSVFEPSTGAPQTIHYANRKRRRLQLTFSGSPWSATWAEYQQFEDFMQWATAGFRWRYYRDVSNESVFHKTQNPWGYVALVNGGSTRAFEATNLVEGFYNWFSHELDCVEV